MFASFVSISFIVVERSETTLYVFPSSATHVVLSKGVTQRRTQRRKMREKSGSHAFWASEKYRGGRRAKRGDPPCTIKKNIQRRKLREKSGIGVLLVQQRKIREIGGSLDLLLVQQRKFRENSGSSKDVNFCSLGVHYLIRGVLPKI